jgi:hypothetical protein
LLADKSSFPQKIIYQQDLSMFDKHTVIGAAEDDIAARSYLIVYQAGTLSEYLCKNQ